MNENITSVGMQPLTLGQKTAANSLPVTLASDQGPLTVGSDGIQDTSATTSASGNAAAPVAAATIIGAITPGTGVWKVTVNSIQAGTVDANPRNMVLNKTGAAVVTLLSMAAMSTRVFRVTLGVSDTLAVVVGAGTGGAGSVYVAAIDCTKLS